jgi:transglutaminase-like putative cysteine protease
MGIEMGQYSHKANNPERVFKQRYGDCKDKSLLLVSMSKLMVSMHLWCW